MGHYRAPHSPDNLCNPNTIFLAGGITGCPYWQGEVADKLVKQGWTVFNPYRENFDVNNPDMEVEQITWEHEHLTRANHILFWFPSETLCPITLFELGAHVYSGANKHIYVGIHPDYKRKRDVEIQVGLQRTDIPIVHSIDELVATVQRNFRSKYEVWGWTGLLELVASCI